MSDMVVLTDEHDNELGTVSRLEAHQKGLWHRIAVIYLLRPDGTIAVQHRKSGWLDHSSAGHVDPGETYMEAAQRELWEELGISGVALRDIGSTQSKSIEQEKGTERLAHIYRVFVCTAEPGNLHPDEVQAITWHKPSDILADMAADPGHKKYCGGFKATLSLLMASPLNT